MAQRNLQKRKNSRKTILRIILWPFILLDRVYHRLLFAISARQTFDGFTLYSVDHDREFFGKAIEALKLLQQVDPQRYGQARQYMPVIAHTRQGGDFYKHAAQAFYVQKKPDDVTYFASQIVHEATHAYLLATGQKYEQENREQHERICTEEQKDFILKVINMQESLSATQKQELAQQWQQWFDEQLTSNWWQDKAICRRQFDALKEALQELFGTFR